MALASTPYKLSDAGIRIVQDLANYGISHSAMAQLNWDGRNGPKIAATVRDWVAGAAHQARIREVLDGDYLKIKGKPYEIKLHHHGQTLSYTSPFIQMGLHPTIIGIVAGYLGCFPRLMHVDAWHTVPIDKDMPRRDSQKWHRDPEDSKLVKVFWYLTDVDEASGALEYVPNSRPGEAYGGFFPQETPYGTQPDPDRLEAAIPASSRVTCVFPSDHVVLVDTVGFHRGGRARSRDRLLVTWEYATQASWWERSFVLEDVPAAENIPMHERFALL